MSDEGDKTEEATPRRLRKAREDGDSGVSAFAAQSIAFVVAVALVPSTARALASRASADLREVIARVARAPASPAAFDAAALATEFLVLVVPLLAAVGLVGALAHVVQTGGVIATKRLAPTLARLDPVAGLRALFSSARIFAVVRALVGAFLVAALAYAGLRSHLVDVAHVTGRPRAVATVVSAVAGGLAWQVAVLGLVLGMLDAIVVRRSWHRRLRMTKEQVKREHRDAEGDPQLKAARERAYQEMLAQATIANVKNATVVVVNPTHLACALRYDEKSGDEAPIVIANAEGEFAARLVRAARAYAVPVLHDVPLAHALAGLRAGDAIPEALYEAVAEILKELASGRES